jgi:hypothetical protein
MQITNMQQWLWRVTQAISFFVQQSVFSWALPAGVRIPSNATFFLSFGAVACMHVIQPLMLFSDRYFVCQFGELSQTS